jgi:xylitol oxidase
MTPDPTMIEPSATNWAGNLRYGARGVVAPRSFDGLRRVLADAERTGERLRALGTRHSFNGIADTDGLLVSTAALPTEIEIDAERRLVRVSGGIRYGDLAVRVEESGWAIANLASLPHISVAGAVSTGTHGSGDRNGSLAASVASIELITAAGELVTLARGDADFDAVVVGLGAFGVVTHVTLDIEPSFQVEQTVYERLSLDDVLADLDAVTWLGYSVSLFTTWRNVDVVDQLWLKRRPDRDPAAPAEVAGARPAPGPRHPLPGVSAEHCTEQGGVAGPWLERLPHFRMGFTPSNGEELQSEYLVPREHAVAAIRAVRGLASEIAPLLFVSEVRTVAADTLWLSPAFGRDVVGLHFTWRPEQPEVLALLPRIEAALAGLEARPHWGKLFAADAAALAPRYPRFDAFTALAAEYDPSGRFRNAFTDRVLFVG